MRQHNTTAHKLSQKSATQYTPEVKTKYSGAIIGFWKFTFDFSSQKSNIWGKQNSGTHLALNIHKSAEICLSLTGFFSDSMCITLGYLILAGLSECPIFSQLCLLTYIQNLTLSSYIRWWRVWVVYNCLSSMLLSFGMVSTIDLLYYRTG